MNIVTDNKDLDIIIPISLELDAPTKESIVSDILEQNERYGFTRFALTAPGAGWRSYQYPPKEHFIERATMFAEIKDSLVPYGISCGWWNTLTIKSGPSEEFSRMTKADGSKTPFASCPMDTNFQKRLAQDIASFAQIAKPAFILMEDDYSIHAACVYYGCFCEKHLAEFAKRTGREYTREELLDIFQQDTPKSTALLWEWKKLAKDSLVDCSKAIRSELDKLSPEIPIGYMQSGSADADGDCTEEVSRALAGATHTPMSRLYGTFYCGGDTVRIPEIFHHTLYSKQHIPPKFRFYHESDTFPHTRYFTSGSQMRIIMSTAYSFGFDGSIFQTQQILDNPNEELTYGLMFAKERRRFNTLARVARACDVKGVHIPYDPFWYSIDAYTSKPIWTYCIGRFGFPYTTLPAKIAFLDAVQAKRLGKNTLIKYLSNAVFLDGDSAKILCERGFSEYLGVRVGEDIATDRFGYDLGARETVRDGFIPQSKGRNMPIGHMFANGKNGKLLRLSVIDEKCEIVSDAYTFQKEYVCPTMTRFKNSLGGKVVVMGLTLRNNSSQALFNYRRKRLFEELLVWCDDSIAFVKDAPDIFCIMNEAVSPDKSGFKGLLTITNLCFDPVESVSVYLPPAWRKNTKFYTLQPNGEWEKVDVSSTNDGVILNSALLGHESVYLLIV